MCLPLVSIYEHRVILVSVHKLPPPSNKPSQKNIVKWPKLDCGDHVAC